MDHCVRACALAALACCSIVPPVRGEEPAPAFGEELVVQARRLRPSDATSASTVVDAGRYAGEAKTVAELVTTAPGVAVNDYGGLGQLSTISLRGSSGDEVQVYLDGLPLNSAAGGGVDLSRIPRQWIDRIEVVRGTAGAVYGPGALGGAVNIVTRRSAAGAWSAEATGGSFATWGAAADGALGGERWGLFAAVAADGTRGDFGFDLRRQQALPGGSVLEAARQNDAALSGGALTKLWLWVGEDRLDAVVQLSAGTRGLPGDAYGWTLHDHEDDARLGVVARWTHPLASNIDLDVGASGREDHLTVLAELDPPEARQRDRFGEAWTRLTWSAGPSALSLRAAVHAEQLEVDGGVGHAWTGASFSVSDELALLDGTLTLTPALRWDTEGPFAAWSERLGGALRLGVGWSIRASGGHAWRFPSFGELYLRQAFIDPNPDLRPEEAWSADAAVTLEGRCGLASLGAFGQRYQDLIVWVPIYTRKLHPENDAAAAAAGLELEVATPALGSLGASASLAYTWLATQSQRGSAAVVGKELPHRAAHRLFARMGVAPGRWAAHAEAHAVSGQEQTLENDPASHIPPALTFNAGASVRLWRDPAALLALEVRNLLDDRSLQNGFGYPLPGRSVMVTLRLAGSPGDVTP